MGKRTPARIAERLQAVFERIDRPGAFCVRGALGVVLPGLEVEGMGSIGLPLTAAQARALRRRCEQAPYGKGTQTLVDTRVRRVWRLAPSRFELTNPAWPELLGVAVARVQAELGLERQRLTAHLHDLLLYEEGCFFKPHRDGEKRDRIVATLVIALPAVHGGGELVVRHEGQEQIIDFSGPEGRHQIQFAAFYADCEHEVKPLQSGHRLCLVYNLALAKSRAPLGAPLSQGHIADAAEVLREWAGASGRPQKLAVTLAHRYTADGLAWDALKGIDARGPASWPRRRGQPTVTWPWREKAEFKRTRFLWLTNPDNLRREERTRLSALLRLNSPIVKAYLLKEDLCRFWEYRRTAWAAGHVRQWLWRASHSRLRPFQKLAPHGPRPSRRGAGLDPDSRDQRSPGGDDATR